METITVTQLLQLASDLGLACIEREDNIIVVGFVDMILFKKLEDNKCQLTHY